MTDVSSVLNRLTWTKSVTDTPNTTMSKMTNATDIGLVRNNDSRLDVVATIAPNETEQWYKFHVSDQGKLTFAQGSSADITQADPRLRVQIYSANGQLIGDSAATSGPAQSNYAALTKGTYASETGNYYIRVSRAANTPKNVSIDYALQTKMGSILQNDYITQVKPSTAAPSSQSAITGTTSPIGSMLINVMASNVNPFASLIPPTTSSS